jgi:hypothetical protein
MIIKCIVAAQNSNGESDFYFVKVDCTQEQYDNGEHYSAACDKAEEEGYDAFLAYDENDVGGKAILDKFAWDSAITIKI